MRILLVALFVFISIFANAYAQYGKTPSYETRYSRDGTVYNRHYPIYQTRLLERTYKYKTRIATPEEKAAQVRLQKKLKAQYVYQQKLLGEQQRRINLAFAKEIAAKQAKYDPYLPARQAVAIKNNVEFASIAMKNALLRKKREEHKEKARNRYSSRNKIHPPPPHIPLEFRIR